MWPHRPWSGKALGAAELLARCLARGAWRAAGGLVRDAPVLLDGSGDNEDLDEQARDEHAAEQLLWRVLHSSAEIRGEMDDLLQPMGVQAGPADAVPSDEKLRSKREQSFAE